MFCLGGFADKFAPHLPPTLEFHARQAKQRDQMADAKRKLSYRMSVIGERAAGWWGSLKSQVQASTEGDRQAETLLYA